MSEKHETTTQDAPPAAFACPHCGNADLGRIRQFDLVPEGFRLTGHLEPDGEPEIDTDSGEWCLDGRVPDGYWCDACEQPFGDRYHGEVLTRRHLELAELALEGLSAGDPESEAENAAALAGVREALKATTT
jgi:hypothetical protein